MMTLNEYLNKNGLSREELATQLNVSVVTVGRYITGRRIPNRVVMPKIREVTDGAVTADSFYS